MEKIKRESLEKLSAFVIDICKNEDYNWFKSQLVKKLGVELGLDSKILDNTVNIKEYLGLSPEISVDYSYLEKWNKLLKVRLEHDNLRMENVRLDVTEKDEMKRFFDYIVYAFYQVENLINAYYFFKYPNINDLIAHFESIPETFFKGSSNHKTIADIHIATKIYSFNRTFFKHGDYTGARIDNLRKVRNEGLHRCTAILKKGKEENATLYNFLKLSSYDSIHNDLKNFSEIVKTNL